MRFGWWCTVTTPQFLSYKHSTGQILAANGSSPVNHSTTEWPRLGRTSGGLQSNFKDHNTAISHRPSPGQASRAATSQLTSESWPCCAPSTEVLQHSMWPGLATHAWLWHISWPAGCTWQILFHPLFCLCNCTAACRRTESLMAFSCQLRNSWPVISSIRCPAQYGEGWQVAASTWIAEQQETSARGFSGCNAGKWGFQVPDSWLPPVVLPKAHAGSLTAWLCCSPSSLTSHFSTEVPARCYVWPETFRICHCFHSPVLRGRDQQCPCLFWKDTGLLSPAPTAPCIALGRIFTRVPLS